MKLPPNPGLQTIAVHAGEEPDPATGALVPPIHLANTFHLGTAEHGAAVFAGDEPGFVYSRWGNPTLAVLEARVAALEGAEAAVATSSGMAAIFAAVMNVLKQGDHLVAAKAIYPSSYHLFDENLRAMGIQTTFVDATDAAQVAAAVQANTRAIYVESPGNPILALCDLSAIAAIARERGIPGGAPGGIPGGTSGGIPGGIPGGASRGIPGGITTICDNTFATPVNQQPLALGIDVVVHSATKYLSGHGDAIGGIIAGPHAFIKAARENPVRYFGGVMAPMNAYLVIRGIHTLPLRMKAHNENAMAVAQFLEAHAAVAGVSYPGLASHPQHDLAVRQMYGFGGMVCFELKGGAAAGAALMNRVRLCSLATSLGDTRTLISHPASTTHHVVSAEARRFQGVTDGLVRLSVGIEDVGDIVGDLEQGLAGISSQLGG